MTPIKNEAFIDLESSLSSKLSASWVLLWTPIQTKVIKAIEDRDWVKAHALLDSVDMAKAVKPHLKFAKTVGMSSLLLGASRVVPPRESTIFSDPPLDLLKSSLTQFEMLTSRNANEGLKNEAHNLLIELEVQVQDDDLNIVLKKGKLDPLSFTRKVFLRGKQFLGLASEIQVSRLSSYGMLVESFAKGIKTYTINEVLDTRICPVCREMHGKTFKVSTGIIHAARYLELTDPDEMKFIAPFPRQSKAGLQALRAMSNLELETAGISLPPFHPRCRGIISMTEKVQELKPEKPRSIFGRISLFGASLSATVLSALFGSNDEEEEP